MDCMLLYIPILCHKMTKTMIDEQRTPMKCTLHFGGSTVFNFTCHSTGADTWHLKLRANCSLVTVSGSSASPLSFFLNLVRPTFPRITAAQISAVWARSKPWSHQVQIPRKIPPAARHSSGKKPSCINCRKAGFVSGSGGCNRNTEWQCSQMGSQ